MRRAHATPPQIWKTLPSTSPSANAACSAAPKRCVLRYTDDCAIHINCHRRIIHRPSFPFSKSPKPVLAGAGERSPARVLARLVLKAHTFTASDSLRWPTRKSSGSTRSLAPSAAAAGLQSGSSSAHETPGKVVQRWRRALPDTTASMVCVFCLCLVFLVSCSFM